MTGSNLELRGGGGSRANWRGKGEGGIGMYDGFCFAKLKSIPNRLLVEICLVFIGMSENKFCVSMVFRET